jgi:myo-inositol-1(or 4)-monophosphatase
MDEKVKTAIVKAAQASGTFLRDSAGSKKAPYELERRAREMMLRELRVALPQMSVWGEGRENGGSVAICPLDAHMNYVRGIGPYGTMAAFIERGEPVFGAVYLPETDELLTAEREKGARLNGRKTESSGKADLSRAVVCCECNVYDEQMAPLSMGAIEALARNAVVWRNLGSPAAEFLWLATGRIDGLIAPMLESAHAAGYLAMQEAGAKVTDREGNPFTLRSASIIAANSKLHQDLFDLVRDSL